MPAWSRADESRAATPWSDHEWESPASDAKSRSRHIYWQGVRFRETSLAGKALEMTEARIISFETGAQIRQLRMELESWRARLRLAYERNWDWRARGICKQEIQRLSDLVRADAKKIA